MPKLPTPQPPKTAERGFLRELMRYHRLYVLLVNREMSAILPSLLAYAATTLPSALRRDSAVERFDEDVDKSIRELFAKVNRSLRKSVSDDTLRKLSKAMVQDVNKKNKSHVAKVARSAGLEIEPLLIDGELNPYFQSIVNQNVGLIRSMHEAEHPKLQGKLIQMISQDRPQRDIAKTLKAHFGMSKSKAQLIARDQTNKLNGALDQYRQQQLGVSRYTWRTMEDERVRGKPGGKWPNARPSHWALDGKVFSWDKPPVSGTGGERLHPGQAILCRCYAEPILDDILE